MRKVFIIAFFGILVLYGCYTASKLNIQNLAPLYNKSMQFTTTEYVVWHNDSNSSTLYYTLDLQDFLYKKIKPGSSPTAKFSVKYELYASYESDIVIDSVTEFFKDSLFYKRKSRIIENFDIPVEYPKTYMLKLIVTDINNKKKDNTFININKSNNLSSQNFLVQLRDNVPSFKNYFSKEEQFRIKYNNSSPATIFVRYYDRNFPIATPPFVMDQDGAFNYVADSLFAIDINNGETTEIMLPKEGFYHFQVDTNKRSGLTLYYFYDDFPEITSAEQVLEPLRYLTTKKEYEKLSTSANIKIAVDSFWISNSGNPERARNQISRYYNRVKDANRFFTSYLEGWKTDRGIIYIIYGYPNVVYRGSDVETWIYGEEGSFLSVKFNFAKVKNPFTDNDYLLTRSPTYKESWYNAVATWRR